MEIWTEERGRRFLDACDEAAAVAVDADGRAYWYSDVPHCDGEVWYGEGTSWQRYRCYYIGTYALAPGVSWRDTLVVREPEPYQWRVPDETTPVDAQVLAWWGDGWGDGWQRCYWADGDGVYSRGKTSWSSRNIMSSQPDRVVLANPDAPDMVPPPDWQPPGTQPEPHPAEAEAARLRECIQFALDKVQHESPARSCDIAFMWEGEWQQFKSMAVEAMK